MPIIFDASRRHPRWHIGSRAPLYNIHTAIPPKKPYYGGCISHGYALTSVHLMCGRLTGVHLTGVYLIRIYYIGMCLMSVHLISMHLIGVYFIGVHLTGVLSAAG